jgi:hypothetical protein
MRGRPRPRQAKKKSAMSLVGPQLSYAPTIAVSGSGGRPVVVGKRVSVTRAAAISGSVLVGPNKVTR